MTKLIKVISAILFFITFSIIFFIYIKTSKNLSDKYFQENKERLQKKARERYKNISKEENEKSYNMKVTKIFRRMKNKSLLSIEKKNYRMSKNALL